MRARSCAPLGIRLSSETQRRRPQSSASCSITCSCHQSPGHGGPPGPHGPPGPGSTMGSSGSPGPQGPPSSGAGGRKIGGRGGLAGVPGLRPGRLPKPGALGGLIGVPGSRRPSLGPKPGARGGAIGVPGSFLPGRLPKPGARGGAMGEPGSFLPGRLPNPGARGGAMGAPGSFLPGRDPNPGARGASIGRPGSFFAGLLPNPGALGASIGLPSGVRRPLCCWGAASGRGVALGSPGTRLSGSTEGSILFGLIGSDGSCLPGTTPGCGPSGPGLGGAAGEGVTSGGVMGTGGTIWPSAGAARHAAAVSVVQPIQRPREFVEFRAINKVPLLIRSSTPAPGCDRPDFGFDRTTTTTYASIGARLLGFKGELAKLWKQRASGRLGRGTVLLKPSQGRRAYHET